MTAHHGPVPVPARITIALDAAGLYGPQVDIDLGGVEPMVDGWEAGDGFPTRWQVEKMAEMTGFPVEWFYAPADELGGEMRLFICDRSRRGENGLTILRSSIDWAGVLHVVEETPPRPPKRAVKPPVKAPEPSPAAAPEGRHEPCEDPDAPGCCKLCRLTLDACNSRYRASRRRGYARG